MKLNYSLRAFAYHIYEIAPGLPKTPIDYHEITICLKGKLYYEVNNKKYVCNEGDLIYLSPNDFRYRLSSSEEKTTYLSINLFGDESPLLEKHFYKNIIDSEIINLIDKLNTAFTFGEKQKIIIMTLLLVEDIASRQLLKKEHPQILKIKNYIKSNVYNKISNDMIAKHIGYSKNYCEALFKKHTNNTLTNFVIMTKIDLARQFIIYDNISLTNLSQKLGFNDYNYFSRCFKKITGITPIKYKNSQHAISNKQ